MGRVPLHNGQIGGQVGVKDGVEAQAAQGGDHLALDVGADGQIEGFPQGDPDGGGGLDHHVLMGVGEGAPDVLGVVLFGDGPGGADHDALAAGDAGHIPQVLLKGAADVGGKAPVVGANHPHRLPLLAGGHAPAAEDALVVVPEHMLCGVVKVVLGVFPGVDVLVVDPEVLAELLQLAVAAAHAGKALLLVGGKDQLQINLAGGEDPLGVGQHLHPLRHRVDAGGHQVLEALYLHHADAAGANLVNVLQKTQGGDINGQLPGSLQDGGALRDGDRKAVNL